MRRWRDRVRGKMKVKKEMKKKREKRDRGKRGWDGIVEWSVSVG